MKFEQTHWLRTPIEDIEVMVIYERVYDADVHLLGSVDDLKPQGLWPIEPIYLGYDIMRQQGVVGYNGQKLYFQESDRASEIFKGLYAVSERIPKQPMSSDQQGDLEICVLIVTPWSHKVEYSKQAWSDLLSVSE